VRVRVRQGLKTTWRTGTATVITGDDPYERQRRLSARSLNRRLNAFVVRIMGTDLRTVRIDLDPAPAGSSSGSG
jgi:hypothetical protein